MARFKMVGETLHVYPDGWQSNVGVFDGVDSIHFHNGCIVSESIYDGIEATHVTFDILKGWRYFDSPFFGKVTDITWNASNLPSELTNYIMPPFVFDKEQPVLDRDINVRIVGSPYGKSTSFTLRKGLKKLVINNIVEKYQHRQDMYKAVAYAYQYYIRPLEWIETYLALVDMEGDDDRTRQFVKRRIARSIKAHFGEADDSLVIRLIEENLLTKPTMTALLDMANDSGRIDVAAAILDKVGGGGRKRFVI